MGQVQTYPIEDALDLRLFMTRLAAEIHDGATHLTALQRSISTLLEKVHHPDLAEEIHMLQDIDRVQQTLVDIANVLDVAAAQPQPGVVARAPVCAAIRLESLRSRLDLTNPADPACSTDDRGESEITWL